MCAVDLSVVVAVDSSTGKHVMADMVVPRKVEPSMGLSASNFENFEVIVSS